MEREYEIHEIPLLYVYTAQAHAYTYVCIAKKKLTNEIKRILKRYKKGCPFNPFRDIKNKFYKREGD